MNSLKLILKDLLPPFVLRSCKGIKQYGFFGSYSSWQEAEQETTGYSKTDILEKVKTSLLKVKAGEALYERDSVLFEKVYRSFPLLTALLRIAVENHGSLSVLDFGGSLGSTYFQCKDFLSVINNLKWCVVEQEHFVSCGKDLFEDDYLKFFYSIETCIQLEQPDVILLSGVIQYLEEPYQFLNSLLNFGFKYILFDRTAFTQHGADRLTIQKVPPEIYPASYPAWFFNRDRFLKVFAKEYDLLLEFDGEDRVNIPSEFKGFFFRRKAGVIS